MVLKRLCIKCGKELREQQEIEKMLCVSCQQQTKKTIILPKKEIEICSVCYKYKINRSWIKPKASTIEELIEEIAHKVAPESNIIEVRYDSKNRLKELDIKTNEGVKNIFIRYSICDECSKYHGNYYEATIQLRGNNEFLENMETQLVEHFQKSKETNAFITKILHTKHGADVYVGSKKAAEKFLKNIKHNKDIEIKKSYTLSTVKDGKKVYRHTILIKQKGKKNG